MNVTAQSNNVSTIASKGSLFCEVANKDQIEQITCSFYCSGALPKVVAGNSKEDVTTSLEPHFYRSAEKFDAEELVSEKFHVEKSHVGAADSVGNAVGAVVVGAGVGGANWQRFP